MPSQFSRIKGPMGAMSKSVLSTLLNLKPTTQAEHKKLVCDMYRQTLRELKIWPSIKRARMRHEARCLYRTNARIQNKADIHEAVKMGKNGLQTLIDQNDSFARRDITEGLNYTFKGPY